MDIVKKVLHIRGLRKDVFTSGANLQRVNMYSKEVIGILVEIGNCEVSIHFMVQYLTGRGNLLHKIFDSLYSFIN